MSSPPSFEPRTWYADAGRSLTAFPAFDGLRVQVGEVFDGVILYSERLSVPPLSLDAPLRIGDVEQAVRELCLTLWTARGGDPRESAASSDIVTFWSESLFDQVLRWSLRASVQVWTDLAWTDKAWPSS